MKRFITLLLVIFFAVCGSFSLFACGGSDSGNSDGGGGKGGNGSGGSLPLDDPDAKKNPYYLSGTNVFDDGCYILMDFETYWEVVQPVWGRSFGKVTMINDKQFVTRGNYSVKLEILGREEWVGPGVRPLLYLETKNQYFDKQDFSDCDYIAFDIYNALDVENTIWSFAFEPGYSYENIVLQPGWNHVQLDITEEMDVSNVGSIWVQFNRGEMYEETQVFYLDNVRAHKKTA